MDLKHKFNMLLLSSELLEQIFWSIKDSLKIEYKVRFNSALIHTKALNKDLEKLLEVHIKDIENDVSDLYDIAEMMVKHTTNGNYNEFINHIKSFNG